MHTIIHIAEPAAPAGALAACPDAAASDRLPPVPGYYFVMLSARGRKRHFGPFATWPEARMVQQSALALGVVAAERRRAVAPPPGEERRRAARAA